MPRRPRKIKLSAEEEEYFLKERERFSEPAASAV